MALRKHLYSKKFFIANLVVLGVIAGFLLAFAGGSRLQAGAPGGGSASLTLPAAAAESPVQVSPEVGAALSAAESVQSAFRYVAKNVLPSVVELDVVDKVAATPEKQPSNPFEYFFGPQNDGQGTTPPDYFGQEGLGSGVIVKRDGKTVYVLTNNHVAGNAEKITVVLYDGREFPGTLVGGDERKDIALVKFETQDADIKVATLGKSSAVQVGDWAVAVGSPLGYGSSVTAGIVSAVGRDGGPDGNINDFIQTDASINKGNSGGALVNIRGEIIGINSWIASQTGGSQGLGFAIPIDNVKGAIDDFIQNKKIEYGWLGVSLLNLGADNATARELGIAGRKGAFVANVFSGGPAALAGLLPGDFVISINGAELKSQEDLTRRVGDIPAGSTAAIELLRNGKQQSLKVKIAKRDNSVATSNKDIFPGLSILSLKSESIDQKKLPKDVSGGVLVTDVVAKSPASVMGVKSGDIIVAVAGVKIGGAGDFFEALNDPRHTKLTFTIVREGQKVDTLAFNRD